MPSNAAAALIIIYPQENTNTEALSKYSWRHGGQQLYQNTTAPQETSKNQRAASLNNHCE